jgi:RNA polymerase-binding transcription factor DksA
MAHSRKSAPSRPKAKKAASMTKGAPKAAPKVAAKHAPVAKLAVKPVAKSTVVKPIAKLAPKAGAKPLPVKAGVKGTLKPKIKPKNMPRPPAGVHPIGVLPPESISRVAQKPARPLPMTPRPAAKPRPAVVDSSDQGVTADDYPEFQQRLLEARVRVLKEMGHYENTVLKVNQRDSAGDRATRLRADVGTDAMEREKAFQLARPAGPHPARDQRGAAPDRAQRAPCESCENPILRARLEAMPVARLCLSCKEKEERAARGMS